MSATWGGGGGAARWWRRLARRTRRLTTTGICGRVRATVLNGTEIATNLATYASRWLPSALGLARRGHHPVTSSSSVVKRKVSEADLASLRAALEEEEKRLRRWRQQQRTRTQQQPVEPLPVVEDEKRFPTTLHQSATDVLSSVVSTVMTSSGTKLSGFLGSVSSAPQLNSTKTIRNDDEGSVLRRTRRLVRDLDATATATDVHQSVERLQRLCLLLHSHPWVRGAAIRENAVGKLLHLRRINGRRNEGLSLQLNEGLALLGHHDPPSSGRGLKILSIDGGGMKGIVALEMLKAIEEKSGKKIHQLFDLICGVSTGAVIAALLAFRRMPVDTVEETYNTIGVDVFRSRNFFQGARGWVASHSYYDTKLLEQVFRTAFGGESKTIDTQRSSSPPPKVAIVSTLASDERVSPYVFRNYVIPHGNTSNYRGSHEHPIWSAVRASTAAPGYFDDFCLDGSIHQDGGVMTNNATQIAIHEARNVWPGARLQCVVSLGLGRRTDSFVDAAGRRAAATTTTKRQLSLREKFSRIVDSATDTELVHESLHDLMPGNVYYRFNPYLSDYFPLDETRAEKFVAMKRSTQMYLRRNDNKLSNACKQLTVAKWPWTRILEALAEYRTVVRTRMSSRR